MSKVVLYMSMSLDGFITGPDDRIDHGLGVNGERLHDWLRAGGVDPGSHRPVDGPSATVFGELMAAIRAAQEYAGDRIIDMAAGQIGGRALRLGLIDQVVVNLVPVVFGSGRPYFTTGPLPRPILFDNPAQVVLGDRVTHLEYDVAKD
jgi:hypothetical protein